MSKEKMKSDVVAENDRISQVFYFLFTANLLMYMEAGAVPASLLPLSSSFRMSLVEQGLLGGIVFLSIACGGPFAGIITTSSIRTTTYVFLLIHEFGL